MIHLHWQFIGYEEKTENGQLNGASEVDIINYANEEDALDAVKKILSRPQYFLKKVFECNTCDAHKKQQRILERFLEKMK